jgi:hypothetical protein
MITTSDGEIYEDETAHALGVEKQQKPVTLAMNLENIQPSKHTQVRGIIADALTNFRNSLPHTNIEDMGEGVIPKESGLSQTMVKGLTSAGDRAVKRVDKMELNALDFQKKMDDWVANGKEDDPIPDPF